MVLGAAQSACPKRALNEPNQPVLETSSAYALKIRPDSAPWLRADFSFQGTHLRALFSLGLCLSGWRVA